jgi:DNA-binding transcriptional LysR family regulator
MISTRHKIFIEVASQLSFSKASEALFISQPAISKHIKELESHYKTFLFERNGSKIKLTNAGKLLLQKLIEAQKIQNDINFEISVLNNFETARGHLKLGASTTVALYFIPKFLSKFHKKYPEININLLNRNTDTIVNALLNNEIDIGIVEGKANNNALIYKPFISDDVIAVCSEKSYLSKQKRITINDLYNYPLILREQGSGTLAALKEKLAENGFKLSGLKVNVRLSGTEALKNFLKEDDSLGFLPRVSIQKELDSGELVEIIIEGLKITRDFFFIQRRGFEDLALNKLFIKHCIAML